MNINRDYLIINDVKKSNIKLDNGSMFFYITDKNTQNIFVNLVINVSNNELIQKYANIENAEDYTLTMNIVKPNNDYRVVEGKLHDKEKAIFEFNLEEDCCDIVGTYKCELLTECNINEQEEITTSNSITYKVKKSVLNDLDDIVEAPEYPLVIQLFDKLSDIEQYEEDRRANELARQLAEQQRQTRFNTLDADMIDRVNAMDDKMVDVENRVQAKEQAVDKLIVDTKKDIDDYKVAKDTEIDEYKTAKDQQIDQAIADQNNKIDDAIANQNNKIDTAISNQNDKIEAVQNNDSVQNNKLDTLQNKATIHEERITATEVKNTEQDNRLDIIENTNTQQNSRLTTIEDKNVEQDNRLDSIEAVNVSQDNRLDAIEIKNQQQDDRLLDVEKVNKRQDMDLKCLFAESKNNMIDVTEEGNSIYLQNSTVGYTLIDEIQGNTLVNCNKEPDKEIILNGNINTRGYSNITLTEGVDGGLVDVALEGNTMVNVCDQKDPVAITKSYTVETGNHVALQGEYNGKCRPVVTGNTLVNLIDTKGNEGISGDRVCSTLTDTEFIFDWSKGQLYNNWIQVNNNVNLIQEGKTYTVIINILENNPTLDGVDVNDELLFNIWFNGFNTVSEYIPYGTTGLYKYTFSAVRNSAQTRNIIGVRVSSKADTATDSAILINGGKLRISRDILILEGDYTNKPIPGYFEGLQSSFEDKVVTQEMVDNGEELADNLGKYKVQYKTTGKNLFDKSQASSNSNTGMIDVKPNTTYYCYTESHMSNGALAWLAEYDSYGNKISTSTIWIDTFTTGQTTRKIILNSNVSFIDSVVLSLTPITEYEPYKEYKKTFYLNSPLLEGDTIEQQGDNVVHVHRYGKVVLDGSEDEKYKLHVNSNDSKRFQFEAPNQFHAGVDYQPDNRIICDKYPIKNFDTSGTSNNFISAWGYADGSGDNFAIFNSCTSIDEFRTGLQSDPVTVAYKLATPTYEVISQNDTILCDSYVNGHLDVDSVVPIEKVDFLPFTDELTYLYASTQYAVQFVSNAVSKVDITLGGAELLNQDVVVGTNKYMITTPSELVDNKLVMSGVGLNIEKVVVTDTDQEFGYFEGMKSVGECKELEITSANSDNSLSNTQQLTHEPLRAVGDAKDRYVLIDGKWFIEKKCGIRAYQEGDKDNYKTDLVNTVYPLEMPIYEEIDYNPLEVYSELTHISVNSTIPCNIIVKNHGFNCLLKPSTTYTVSSNLGLNIVTTPSTLTEDCLRFYDTDTSSVTTMNNVMVLEGDYTTNGKPIPSHFSGIESAFEQEYDEEKGKYKVKVKVVGKNLFDKSKAKSEKDTGKINIKPNTTYYVYGENKMSNGALVWLHQFDCNDNEITSTIWRNGAISLNQNTAKIVFTSSVSFIDKFVLALSEISEYEPYKENYIEFYINEPLRGIGDVKDKVYVKDDKLVVQRNCGIRPYEDGDFGTYLTDKVNTVYQLAEPTYEEVEYNDVKLFIESFKNSTLFYNSNVPVTSKLYYSYSVPIVDTVAKTANVTDQQDSIIIDLATQVAVMEMMLM